jgi:hypothetical protein
MHDIEPYYNWREYYQSEDDEFSPFFGREYSEFYFNDQIYNHYIHPQWDFFGSPTLVLKTLYADYDEGIVIMEMFGEWNDCLNNDIMFFKRDVIEPLMESGISKFILIGENVLNFHSSDDCYYEEWFDEITDQDGWIALINFREHVLDEFKATNIDYYFILGGSINEINWRTYNPSEFSKKISNYVARRLDPLSSTSEELHDL